MAVFYQKSSLEPQVSINLNFPPTKWCLENMIWQRQTLVRRRFSCVWKHNLFLTSKKVFWKLSLLKRFKKVVCSQQLSNMCCKSWPLLTCHFVNVALPILAHHPLRFPSLRRLCYQPKPSGFPGIKIKDFWRENSNCRIPNEIILFVSLFDAKIQIHLFQMNYYQLFYPLTFGGKFQNEGDMENTLPGNLVFALWSLRIDAWQW